MALATTCPACSTSFKVNPEQLKLRRGLVRCGKCEHVFSGVEYLRYVSDSQTEADLNPPDTGGDRRKGDRRESFRPPFEDDTSSTDELKTAFFLPDSELLDERDAAAVATPADAASPTGATPAGDATKQPANQATSQTTEPTTDSAAGPSAAAASADADVAPPATSADGKPATDAETTPPTAAPSAQDEHSDRSRNAGQSTPTAARSDPQDATDAAAPTGPESAGAANPKPAAPPAPTDEASSPPARSDTEAREPGRIRPAMPRVSKPVVTTPLTQSPRGANGGKPSRDDTNWVKAPVWPSIDEHFDEPDIEEPDSAPGPNSPTWPASTKRASPPMRPVATGVAGSDEDAIDFFGQTSKPAIDFDLPSRRAWLIAVALGLLLIVQLALGNRDVLASRFPTLATPLGVLGKPFGLTVQLPMSGENIKIASFDLVTASAREPDASYVMNLLMRNKAQYAVRWPAIELTLLDDTGGILVRKVLLADQYVPDQLSLARGLGASSEQPIRVGLKSHTSAPVGYSVSLFYP